MSTNRQNNELILYQIESINGDLKEIKEKLNRDVKEIKDGLKADFITRSEFEPIKRLVYGFVAMILVAVIGAVIALVIRQ